MNFSEEEVLKLLEGNDQESAEIIFLKLPEEKRKSLISLGKRLEYLGFWYAIDFEVIESAKELKKFLKAREDRLTEEYQIEAAKERAADVYEEYADYEDNPMSIEEWIKEEVKDEVKLEKRFVRHVEKLMKYTELEIKIFLLLDSDAWEKLGVV